MATAASFTSTVGIAGFEVPVWVFLVVTVLLVLGGVAALLVRPVDEGARAAHVPFPATATVLFFAAVIVFFPMLVVLVEDFW
ncbi:hypothetical protein [Curtobacterium flaccumfaciens]|uniref:hypothetical protein n=1 Tax=Curtobacterium flaccumfaciens TaxID=2035 RepID=UPI001BDE6953|nr:hypothetical protein [Curtobacterium flaccumfaciens]MBT1608611.1 hypothetical protein [Curtobacterium flaccumfaciens pv. betae]MBT1658498.1 hypothetical protein [Curtobacterium flaccumfaciens pv. betae]MCS0472872.1 hypothetical protein [Curtobacterium flaccumfaciens pv. betae]MCS0476274.1 hypothetical protein [Curtobacterium flaccumfaciens pv. betae]MCS0479728.1 hypothetical protein [Curtobacterium flaccumfaciens pv. betae]